MECREIKKKVKKRGKKRRDGVLRRIVDECLLGLCKKFVVFLEFVVLRRFLDDKIGSEI